MRKEVIVILEARLEVRILAPPSRNHLPAVADAPLACIHRNAVAQPCRIRFDPEKVESLDGQARMPPARLERGLGDREARRDSGFHLSRLRRPGHRGNEFCWR